MIIKKTDNQLEDGQVGAIDLSSLEIFDQNNKNEVQKYQPTYQLNQLVK